MDGDEKLTKVSAFLAGTYFKERKNVRRKNEEMNEEENSEPEENGEPKKNSGSLDEGVYEVDRIRDVAAVDGELRYLVAWKDYGSDQDTWEPEEYLETARLFVDEYNASHLDKVRKARQLVKAQKKKLMKEERLKKRKLKSHGNDSSEQSEVTNVSSALRSKKRIVVSSEDEDDRDEDYRPSSGRGLSPKGLKRRPKRVVAKPQVVKTEEKKPTSTDSLKLEPKRKKYAWLFDDQDSDTSGRSEKSPVQEKFIIEGVEESTVKVREHASSCSDKKNSFNKKEQDKVVEENMQKAPTYGLGLPEPKVEFTGIVQCRDGTIKALYNKKDETRTHVVSIKEAYELDSSGLVQYFISRCEFGEPQSSKK